MSFELIVLVFFISLQVVKNSCTLPGPFRFLILCICLQDFCIFLLPITRTHHSFSGDYQQANGTHFAHRLREAEKPRNLHFLKMTLNNEWCGSMKALAPFSSGQDSSEEKLTVCLWDQAEATRESLLKITLMLSSSLLCLTCSILFLVPLKELSL